MESSISSPHYMKATSSSHAKKDSSPNRGSGFDDMVSMSSSTGGSAYAPKQKGGMRFRTTNKKALINLGNGKSFRRRIKPRVLQSFEMTDSTATSEHDSLPDSSELLSSSSEVKKTTSQGCSVSLDDGNHDDMSSNPARSKLVLNNRVPLKTLSRMPSNRNVRILTKRTSFKSRKSLMNRPRVSDDVVVDRATYSSTLKDSKFHEPLEVRSETVESERSDMVHICRYHHCSLHGHCHEDHDPVTPPKHFMYKNKPPVKKQKHPIDKAGLSSETICSGGKKTNLRESEMISRTELSLNDEIAFSDVKHAYFGEKPNIHANSNGFSGNQELDFFELAFGETSFPERSYQDTLDIMRKYEGMSFGPKWHCLTCSCFRQEQILSNPRGADEDLPQCQVSASSFRNESFDNVPLNVNHDALDPFSFSTPQEQLLASLEDSATSDQTSTNDVTKTTAMFDEASRKNIVSLSVSDSQVSSDTNSDREGECTVESTDALNSLPCELEHDSGTNASSGEGKILQFTKPRHISMWHLIHQHMASELATESANNPFLPAEDERPKDSSDSLLSMQISGSVQEFSDSNMSDENSTETQDIEVRKLLAIKLVREAIEKILLPEIQDDQSVSSENLSQQDLTERNENEASTLEPNTVPTNPRDLPMIFNKDASSAVKSEKKAPKHWSNLKKWILLQRFIKELEKVKKFNPGKPQILPLHPDPEAEKVNLRHQTVDEKKKGEEWMLDYALRQAVNQLAPTQKKKVALLVKAFETVVPPQEDSPMPFRTSRLKESTGLSRSLFHGNGGDEEELSVDPTAGLSENYKISRLESTDQVTSTRSTGKSWNFLGLMGEMAMNSKYLGPSAGEKPEESENGKGKSSLATQMLITDDSSKLTMSEKEETGKPGNKGMKGTSSDCREESESLNLQSDKKNHIKMWHTIYQHVVSGIADKFGGQILNESDEDYDAEENEGFDHHFVVSSGGAGSNRERGFTQADALKLVKEAVDEILVTEAQDDSSDTQSITSELTEREILEENLLEPKTPRPKNWIKLKRILLIKKSIKVLEKARDINKQTRELLSEIPDTEPEKVDLERQMVDERKRARQWMLDYAVQHIVDKLTPARKRKVYMLVEAFEAVVPFPEM